MNPITYTLWLDDLNRIAAVYEWNNGEHDAAAITFTIPRDVWAQMGRPASLTIEVTS